MSNAARRHDRTISRTWWRRWLYVYMPPYRWWKQSALHDRYWLWRFKRSAARLRRAIAAMTNEAQVAQEQFAKTLRRQAEGS
jgi:hypothetical protein